MPDNKPITSLTILESAAEHQRQRAIEYDSPDGERSMEKVIKVFNAHHDLNLSEEQGWHFMEILKSVRFFSAKGYHSDSVEDGVSYTSLRGEARARHVGALHSQPKQPGFARDIPNHPQPV